MTNIFYDCEFIDNGSSLEPISLALVVEDMEPLYWVTSSVVTHQRILGHEWLRENVLPQLPLKVSEPDAYNYEKVYIDYSHPDAVEIFNLAELPDAVEDFILSVPNPQLWADYGAYDHVMLAQLWGPMINLPEGVPMYTNEFRTLLLMSGVDEKDIPVSPEEYNGRKAHNALYDANELRMRYQWLVQHSPTAHALDHLA